MHLFWNGGVYTDGITITVQSFVGLFALPTAARAKLPCKENHESKAILGWSHKTARAWKKNYSLVGIMGNPEKVRAQKAGYNALFMKDPAS